MTRNSKIKKRHLSYLKISSRLLNNNNLQISSRLRSQTNHKYSNVQIMTGIEHPYLWRKVAWACTILAGLSGQSAMFNKIKSSSLRKWLTNIIMEGMADNSSMSPVLLINARDSNNSKLIHNKTHLVMPVQLLVELEGANSKVRQILETKGIIGKGEINNKLGVIIYPLRTIRTTHSYLSRGHQWLYTGVAMALCTTKESAALVAA